METLVVLAAKIIGMLRDPLTWAVIVAGGAIGFRGLQWWWALIAAIAGSAVRYAVLHEWWQQLGFGSGEITRNMVDGLIVLGIWAVAGYWIGRGVSWSRSRHEDTGE